MSTVSSDPYIEIRDHNMIEFFNYNNLAHTESLKGNEKNNVNLCFQGIWSHR
jgi:hypothetical protein